MNRYEIKHEELKKQLAMLGIFDSEAERKEIKVNSVYLDAAGEQETEINGNLVPTDEVN